jgi:polar amino acid transport system substrate-binding protein
MKKLKLISSLMPVILCLGTHIGLADEINLRADNWCPYNCDARSDKPGLIVDIARAIMEPAGHIVNYQIMPWSRALTEVRKGRIQGVIGAQQSEAPDLIYGSIPVALDDNGFAIRHGERFNYQGPASLNPYRIGGILDYNYDGGEIDEYIKNNSNDKDRIQLNTGDDVGIANLRKLLARRVDIVMDSAVVLTYLVGRLGLESQIDVVPLGHPTEIYIAFSPADSRSKMWAEQISSGIVELRKSGEMARILARYGLTNSQLP